MFKKTALLLRDGFPLEGVTIPKRMNFRKSLIYVADFGPLNSAFRACKKIAICFSENEEGGQRLFVTFPKIHPFYLRPLSLIDPPNTLQVKKKTFLCVC